MDDKFIRGLIAGVLAGIIRNIMDLLMGSMGLTTIRFIDWTAIFLYAHASPYTPEEMIVSLIGQIFFDGSLGVIFVYLISLTNNSHPFIKSLFFSVVIWFAVDTIATLYMVVGTVPTPLITCISNGISSIIFGLALAQCLRMFEHPATASSLVPKPAMKIRRNRR